MNYKTILLAALLLSQSPAHAGRAGEGGIWVDNTGSAICKTTEPVQLGTDGPLVSSSISFSIREDQTDGTFPVVFWSNEVEEINGRVALKNPGKQGNTLENEYNFHGEFSDTKVKGSILLNSCTRPGTSGCASLMNLSGTKDNLTIDSNAAIVMSSRSGPRAALGFPAFKTFQMKCRD